MTGTCLTTSSGYATCVVMTPQDAHPIIDLLGTLGRILSAPLGELLRWLLQRRLARQSPALPPAKPRKKRRSRRAQPDRS